MNDETTVVPINLTTAKQLVDNFREVQRAQKKANDMLASELLKQTGNHSYTETLNEVIIKGAEVEHFLMVNVAAIEKWMEDHKQ